VPIDLADAGPPPGGVFRVARRSTGLFGPPSWAWVNPDTGTFGNRFDDPGQVLGIPEGERFRVISCATARTGAYGEVLAHLRPSLGAISRISGKTRDTGHRTIDALAGVVDPEDASARLIAAEWRQRRQVGHAVLDPRLRFADVGSARTLGHLRGVPELARLASELGLADVDLSAMASQARPFTQACARHIHELVRDGAPQFAGIRYLSRLGAGPEWECWALFDDRVAYVEPPIAQAIPADDPALLEIAHVFHLTIETDDGGLIRPWAH